MPPSSCAVLIGHGGSGGLFSLGQWSIRSVSASSRQLIGLAQALFTQSHLGVDPWVEKDPFNEHQLNGWVYILRSKSQFIQRSKYSTQPVSQESECD